VKADYYKFAVADAEVPTLLISITVTEAAAELLSCAVKGYSQMNWAPHGADDAL
jgi:hypothetical protein